MSGSPEEWYGEKPAWYDHELGANYNVLATSIFAKVKRAKSRELAMGSDETIEWTCPAYYPDPEQEQDIPARLMVRCHLGSGAVKAVGIRIGDEIYEYDEKGPAAIKPDGTLDRESVPDDHVSDMNEKVHDVRHHTPHRP